MQIVKKNKVRRFSDFIGLVLIIYFFYFLAFALFLTGAFFDVASPDLL